MKRKKLEEARRLKEAEEYMKKKREERNRIANENFDFGNDHSEGSTGIN
jgi:hypothetical protein